MMKSQTILQISILLIAAVSHVGWAQDQDICDPGLAGSPNSALGYSMRDDRCEGLYALQVNSKEIRLVSLVETFQFDSQSGVPLTVRWSTVQSNARQVRLRAQSLRPRFYYRMDTLADAAAGSYLWPVEILGAIRLRRDDLGLLGWFEHELEGSRLDVYLPLRITQDDAGTAGPDYEIALIPDIRLREISVTLIPIDPEGTEGEPILDKKPLELGHYPAKEATVFHLPKPEAPGLYRLELICERMSSGIATTNFWLYHSE